MHRVPMLSALKWHFTLLANSNTEHMNKTCILIGYKYIFWTRSGLSLIARYSFSPEGTWPMTLAFRPDYDSGILIYLFSLSKSHAECCLTQVISSFAIHLVDRYLQCKKKKNKYHSSWKNKIFILRIVLSFRILSEWHFMRQYKASYYFK